LIKGLTPKEYLRRYREQHQENLRKYRQNHKDYFREYNHNRWLAVKANPELCAQAAQRQHIWHQQQKQKPDYREKLNIRRHTYTSKCRLRALNLITRGGPLICAHCGCDDLRLIEINHRNGGGVKERRVGGNFTGINFYAAIVNRTRTTEDLELTCRLCNARHYLERKVPETKGRILIRWCPPSGLRS
jgi:hypothetical protein